MRVSVTGAMASYVTLALLGAWLLSGKMLLALWIFLAGLAAKTLIAWKKY